MPGAGWGLTDSHGRHKPAMWFLKRAWASRGVYLTDEGLDGMAAHIVNERAEAFPATLEVTLYRDGKVPIAQGRAALEVPGRGTISRQVDALVGYFTDTNNAYRFGPPQHDVVAVRLLHAESGELLGEDFHFPLGLDLPVRTASITASVEVAEELVKVSVSSDVFLLAVEVSAPGYLPDDNYFHVAPGRTKLVTFRREAQLPFEAVLQPLNVRESLRIAAAPSSHGRDGGALGVVHS
jgi:beta-mannosidase